MPRARLRASGPLGQLPSRLSDRHARGFTSAAATCQPSEFEKARGSLPAASRLTGENGLAAGAIKDPAVYQNLAIIFMNKKRPDDARAFLTKAITADPRVADNYY